MLVYIHISLFLNFIFIQTNFNYIYKNLLSLKIKQRIKSFQLYTYIFQMFTSEYRRKNEIGSMNNQIIRNSL